MAIQIISLNIIVTSVAVCVPGAMRGKNLDLTQAKADLGFSLTTVDISFLFPLLEISHGSLHHGSLFTHHTPATWNSFFNLDTI